MWGLAVTQETRPAESTAERLRRAFDETFSVATSAADTDVQGLLCLGVRGEPYAVRLGEVTALLADQKIVPLPGSSPELLGLTGVRGAVVPVYDLGGLLGLARASQPPRFLVVAGELQSVGLSFERFDGYARVQRSQISSAAADAARLHCREVARVGPEARAVVAVGSILDTITEKVAAMRATRER